MRIANFTTSSDQVVALGSFTVFVGANNVGKSQTLRDLHTRIVVGEQQARGPLAKALELAKPLNFSDIVDGLEQVTRTSSAPG
jgi:predicted ATPase